MSKPLYSLFAQSIFFMACYADTSNISTCAPSTCGNNTIRYPFWRWSAEVREFCGYPDFGLECSENGPIMTLPSDTYYVTNINYDNHSITLVDMDVVNQKCPRAKNNVSLHNLPLSFSQLDLNLSFYFNCSFYPQSVNPIGCLKNSYSKNESFVFVAGDVNDSDYAWGKNCEENVVVTVKQEEIEISDLITGFGAAMNKGFVLDWMKAGDCAECEISDGFCGFDQVTKKSRCMCSDGRIVARSCKKGTLVLAS